MREAGTWQAACIRFTHEYADRVAARVRLFSRVYGVDRTIPLFFPSAESINEENSQPDSSPLSRKERVLLVSAGRRWFANTSIGIHFSISSSSFSFAFFLQLNAAAARVKSSAFAARILLLFNGLVLPKRRLHHFSPLPLKQISNFPLPDFCIRCGSAPPVP